MNKELLATIVIAVIASAGFVSISALQKSYNVATDDPNTVRMKGHLTVVLKDAQGKVKDYREIDNVVMKVGKEFLGIKTFSAGNASIPAAAGTAANVIAVGTAATTNATTPGFYDRNALQTECAGSTRQTGTVTYNRQGTTAPTLVNIVGTFAALNCPASGTASIAESGLFDATTVGNMFAHQYFAVINKGASDSLTVTWTITLT